MRFLRWRTAFPSSRTSEALPRAAGKPPIAQGPKRASPAGQQKPPRARFRLSPVRNVFGLDISDASVEGVELKFRRGGGFEIRAYNRILLPKDVIADGDILRPDALQSALKSLLDGARPERFSNHAVVTLPEAKVYVHTFDFPVSLREKEVRNAIPYEAEGVIPVDLSTMETDLLFHRSQDQKTRHVFFAAVPRTLVAQYASALRAVGVEPVAFDVESAALARSVAGPRAEPVVVADIGARRTTLIVVEHETVHGAVSISVGGDTVTDAIMRARNVSWETAETEKETFGLSPGAEPPIRSVMEEALQPVVRGVVQLLRLHESHTGRPVGAVILAGGTALLKGLDRLVAEATQRNVRVGDPFATPDIRFPPELTTADVGWLEHGRIFFATSVGLGIRGARWDPPRRGMNLLPAEIRRRYLSWRENLAVSVLSLLAVGVCTSLLVLLGNELLRTQFHARNVRAEAEPIRIVLTGQRLQLAKAETEAVNSEVSLLQSFLGSRVDALPFLERLRAIIPEGVRLSEVDLSVPAGSPWSVALAIRGTAATRENFLTFEQNVRAMPLLLEVDSPLTNLDVPTAVQFSLDVKVSTGLGPSPGPSPLPSPP